MDPPAQSDTISISSGSPTSRSISSALGRISSPLMVTVSSGLSAVGSVQLGLGVGSTPCVSAHQLCKPR